MADVTPLGRKPTKNLLFPLLQLPAMYVGVFLITALDYPLEHGTGTWGSGCGTGLASFPSSSQIFLAAVEKAW